MACVKISHWRQRLGTRTNREQPLLRCAKNMPLILKKQTSNSKDLQCCMGFLRDSTPSQSLSRKPAKQIAGDGSTARFSFSQLMGVTPWRLRIGICCSRNCRLRVRPGNPQSYGWLPPKWLISWMRTTPMAWETSGWSQLLCKRQREPHPLTVPYSQLLSFVISPFLSHLLIGLLAIINYHY